MLALYLRPHLGEGSAFESVKYLDNALDEMSKLVKGWWYHKNASLSLKWRF
jgi:hypothetical protein